MSTVLVKQTTKLDIITHYLAQYPNARTVSQLDMVGAAGYVLLQFTDCAVALDFAMALQDVENIHCELHPSRLSNKCYVQINL